jgi:catechol 2,3-dioxygenase-like lactoylglutathione lyase family enzyme
MLGSCQPIAFVATSDGTRAREFYEGVLGLGFVADEPVALVFDASGVMLRVTKVQSVTPAGYTVLGWRVDDIAAAAKELATKGVTFERYQGFQQDELGIWNAPDGAKVAWFKDPDGNLLSLTQFP